MKVTSTTEFWFASVLGVVAAAQGYLLLWVGRQVFPLRGHEAFYGLVAFGLFVLFFLITCSCCCWEWLLVRERLRHPNRSLTTSTVVLCTGIAAVLFCISWWCTLYT